MMAYVFYDGGNYNIHRWNGSVYEYLPKFDDYDEAVKYCNDAGIKFPVRIINDGCSIDIINIDEEKCNPCGCNVVESFFFHDFDDSEFELWNRVREWLAEMNFKELDVTIECDVPFPLFFYGDKRKWLDLVDILLEDSMIASCGCDGLLDAFYSLKGLYHMIELGVNLTDEFICEVINKAIDGRNRYCWMNGAEKLPKITVKDGDFIVDQ